MTNPGSSTNLKNLLRSHQEGKAGSFETFYKDSYNVLYVYGLHIESNGEVLKDYIQNFYIEVFLHVERFLPKGNVLPYLLRSFRHFILKSQKLEQRSQSGQTLTIAHSDSPETILSQAEEREEKSQQTAAILKELSPKEREIIYLRYFQEMDAKEVAHVLSIQHQVVRNLAYRALNKIRKKYSNRDNISKDLKMMISLVFIWWFMIGG